MVGNGRHEGGRILEPSVERAREGAAEESSRRARRVRWHRLVVARRRRRRRRRRRLRMHRKRPDSSRVKVFLTVTLKFDTIKIDTILISQVIKSCFQASNRDPGLRVRRAGVLRVRQVRARDASRTFTTADEL